MSLPQCPFCLPNNWTFMTTYINESNDARFMCVIGASLCTTTYPLFIWYAIMAKSSFTVFGESGNSGENFLMADVDSHN